MREIKFRAWDKVSKLMVDDFYIHSAMGIGGGGLLSNKADYILMQYTGLHDKSGKEIYERDILRFKSYSQLDSVLGNPMTEKIKPIFWNECKLCFWVGDTDTGFRPDIETDDNNFEIVGNFYENPDLIKIYSLENGLHI